MVGKSLAERDNGFVAAAERPGPVEGHDRQWRALAAPGRACSVSSTAGLRGLAAEEVEAVRREGAQLCPVGKRPRLLGSLRYVEVRTPVPGRGHLRRGQ